jgi:tRNA threonylcarbamoyladenosine biosynthesis protein TsaB
MKLLALETSTTRLSACLWEDFRIRALKAEPDDRSSHRLLPLLDGLFRKARWSAQDLDAVAVDVGPGRFTGLRLGVTAARTLGLVLQKPVVEVTSLEALAAQGSGWEAGKSFVWKFPQNLLCVLTEAIRDEVYVAVWRFHRMAERGRRGPLPGRAHHTFGHHFKLVHAPTLFPFKRFLTFFQSCFQEQTFLFTGSAAARYRRELQKAFGRRVKFGPDDRDVDPRWVAALGAEKFFRREMKAFSQVQPLYLRPSYVETRAAPAVHGF